MTGTQSKPPPHAPSLLRRILLPVAAVLAAAALFLSVVRVPEGSHGLRRGPGGGRWTVLEPGLHLRAPLLHEVTISPDELTVRDRMGRGEENGGTEYAVTTVMTPEAIQAAAARSLTPGEYLAANVEEILAESPAGGPSETSADLKEELWRRGFRGLIVQTGGHSGKLAARRTLDRPIVLIGLDGADWQVLEPLMDEGRLPRLQRLRAEGAWGHLRSSMPTLSPLLWTTAATGKPPEEHGIVDFLVPDPATGRKAPITSSFRKVKALWNIFGERGLFSSFVAWWATYPAERVHGEIVSDRVAYSLFDVGRPGARGSGLVHPPSLWERVGGMIVDPATLPEDLITRLARVDSGEIDAARKALAEDGRGSSKDRLVHLMKILASTETYHRIALDRIGAGQPDLLAIYYQGVDEVSHRFAHCSPPALDLCPDADTRRYGGTVDAFHEYQDRLLGEILDAVDPGSYVVVMSDHGFRSGGDRPRDIVPDIDGKPAKWHRLYGITVIAGPGIRPGRLDSVTLADIAPTVLRLAGLPLAGDMAGSALVDPEGALRPPRAVASYEGARPEMAVASAAGSPEESPEARDRMLENLRSLGYIGDDDLAPVPSPAEAGETPSTVTAHTNVGALHVQNSELVQAEREFRAALEIAPRYVPALMGLAQVRVMQERHGEALDLTRQALQVAHDPESAVYARYASLALQAGREAQAERELEQWKLRRPDEAEIRTALAILAEDRGDLRRAEGQLAEALEIDPSSPEAMARLFRLRRRSRNEASLEPAIRKALEINPSSVLHRNWLGLILQRRGDSQAAEAQFKEALSIAPDFGGTMANLGSLYGRTGRLEEAVDVLRRALRIEPGNLECRVNLGAALGKLGRTEEALAVLEEGREMAPRSPEVLNALAVTWAQKGDTGQAVALFRESLAIREDQPSVRAMLREIEEGS